MTINAYPLTWPTGWKRTGPADRRFGHFGKMTKTGASNWRSKTDISVAEAVHRVLAELKRMGIERDDVVISTNLKTRLDGLPRSDQGRPADPGVAVYFEDMGRRRCIAVDQYTTVEDNLAAVAATLEAMRAIERHGGAEVLDRAFTGFAALPPPRPDRPWWEVLGLDPTSSKDEIRAAYRRLVSTVHEAKGGTQEQMAELNVARDRGLAA
ncbi:hypothetical protein [Hydrogenophaga sp.]|uniref:hypothetical protein n=1 Tax=Hydrogenophaga sp. TaxID=1904254 RepID=UPI003D111BF7